MPEEHPQLLRERWIARVMVGVYIAFLVLIAAWGFYIVFYLLFLASWVVLAFVVPRLKSFDLVDSLALQKKLILIFVVALVVRLLMFGQDQMNTDDILNYVTRGEAMLGGSIPYVDFYGGSKPPLYNLVILTISTLFGAGQLQFRAVFSAVDACIAMLVLFLCRREAGERFALSAAILYALSPINVITIGFSGHFDPVPTIAVVTSTVLLISSRHRLSSLFLGLGFAFKLFGAALLPYYVSRVRTSSSRALNAIIFLLPMIFSLAGLYLLSEGALAGYFGEISQWKGFWSFNQALGFAVGSSMLGPLKVSWVVMGIFVGIILAMYASLWTRKEKESETILLWYKVVVLMFVFYWGLMVLDGWAQSPSDTDILPFLLILAVYSLLAGIFLMRFRDAIFPKELSAGRAERILIVTTLAVALFCFGIPNYAPWYVIWFLPFLLAIRTDGIRLTLIALSVWHVMGAGVSLLPGLPPIN